MKMRKELNNKGFSLVELLIATIILGIVVAPLLHTFVTAANTTARSRQLGDATLLGENVAEMVETIPMNDLDELFNDPYFAGAANATYSLNSGTGVYSLSAQNVRAGGSTFNVKITLDPTAYYAGNPANNEPINDVKISDYSNMDAIYAQSLDVDNPDLLSWSDFQREADRIHENGEWEASTVEPVRTMTLDITKDASDPSKIKAVLSMDYSYTYSYTVFDAETGVNVAHTNTITVGPYRYDLMSQGFSPATNGRLPNIYVMYYPLYESGRINDIIRINNMIGDTAQPFKIFLVKEEADVANLEVQEAAYNATLEQYVPAGTSASNYAVVYSNIRENLENGSSLGNQVTYKIFRGNYFSIVGRFGGDNPSNDPNYKGGDLVSKTEKNRLFDVTVEVFDVKDDTFTTPVHTFRATKLQ